MTEFFNSLQPWHFYFAIGVLLIGLEMLTFTFDLLWLGLAALAGAFAAWLAPEITWLPMLVSALVAVVLSVLGWRWKKKGLQGQKGYKDPIDDILSQHGKVLEAIAPQHRGIVRVGSEIWSAASVDVLAPGDEVVVIGRSSTILEVRRA